MPSSSLTWHPLMHRCAVSTRALLLEMPSRLWMLHLQQAASMTSYCRGTNYKRTVNPDPSHISSKDAHSPPAAAVSTWSEARAPPMTSGNLRVKRGSCAVGVVAAEWLRSEAMLVCWNCSASKAAFLAQAKSSKDIRRASGAPCALGTGEGRSA